MLWTIAVILLILWLLGFSLHIAGGLIHILLVIAIIVGLIQLFTGRRALSDRSGAASAAPALVSGRNARRRRDSCG